MTIKFQSDTIIAQCTPHGSGALALVRLSGPQALSIATSLSILSSKKAIIHVPTHTIHHGFVVDNNNNHIDEVLFLIMHAPKTFTGDDTVEITCHNNPFIIQSIITLALLHGARSAQPGEFTQQAVRNNKIDLIQAEAINELIHATTQQALKKSLSQVEGTLSHWITDLEKLLRQAHALCEASFEFLDEEIDFSDQLRTLLYTIANSIKQNRSNHLQQKYIRQGIRIALLGAVNAGKSSLFNALLNEKRSIVTAHAGTTRDTIEAYFYTEKWYTTLIDTAGLRTTHDIIEQEGVIRSFDEAHTADIIILVVDGSRQITNEEETIYKKLIQDYEHKIVIAHNKNDLIPVSLPHTITQDAVKLSCNDKKSIDLLMHRVNNKIESLLALSEAPFVLTQRQINLLHTLEQSIDQLISMMAKEPAYELLSIHLQEAQSCLSSLTGKSITEQTMNAIFKEFCVGK